VADHGAIPGRAGREDGDQHASRHQQRSGIGKHAVLGAFAVLEEVGWVGQHQAHTRFGDADAFKGAGDEFGLGEACACDGSALGADLDAVEQGLRDITAGYEQVTLARRRVKDGGRLVLWKRQQAARDALGERGRRAYKGRVGKIG